MTINEFQNEYRFLSNFFPSVLTYEGIIYPTIEHAYQAAKTWETSHRVAISQIQKASDAKRAGRSVQLRGDWEWSKENVMLELLRLKFKDTVLKEKLLLTGDLELIEGNYWHDRYWGICNCKTCVGVGDNKLGKLLMLVRDELRMEENAGTKS